jgi:hypothetical protein
MRAMEKEISSFVSIKGILAEILGNNNRYYFDF